MNWLPLLETVYLLLVLLVCLRIVHDTQNTPKTIAYLLLTIFVPIAGALFYFSFGINYRKRRMYSKKLIQNEVFAERLRSRLLDTSLENWEQASKEVRYNKELTRLLLNDSITSPITSGNRVTILKNGEEKFPEVFAALEAAERFIHLEYYIYEDDQIGNRIKEILIKKAGEGVKIRFIYDDFGSRRVRRRIAPQLRAAGVEAYPFHTVRIWALANRLNYRNHRKLIIVDGKVAFTGGINIGDRYCNRPEDPLYWRDTHLKLEGDGIFFLQYLFMCDWNFCSGQTLVPEPAYFNYPQKAPGDKLVQIAASGPDSPTPLILYSLLQIINLARREILITTPYFIPGESLLHALIVASLSGVSVKLIVPDTSDSRWVNAAARSNYTDLLEAGIEVYLYRRGFVHAKTIVTDANVSVIGTANMDHRSFDLNFEVNTLIYDEETANELRMLFYEDLNDCTRIDPVKWEQRPVYKQLFEKVARLLSPLM